MNARYLGIGKHSQRANLRHMSAIKIVAMVVYILFPFYNVIGYQICLNRGCCELWHRDQESLIFSRASFVFYWVLLFHPGARPLAAEGCRWILLRHAEFPALIISGAHLHSGKGAHPWACPSLAPTRISFDARRCSNARELYWPPLHPAVTETPAHCFFPSRSS